MEKWLWEQLIAGIQALSQGNILLALVLVAAFAAVAGIVLAMIIRIIRALLPFLILAGFCPALLANGFAPPVLAMAGDPEMIFGDFR